MQNYGEVGTAIDTFFDSFSEFVDMANDAPIPPDSIGAELFDNPPNRRVGASSRLTETKDYNGYSWSGATTWPEALDFAYRRWDEGREFMLDQKRLIEHELEGISFKQDFRYDVTGTGMIDIPRHLQGMPDPFLVDRDTDVPVNSKGRNVVRVLYNGTTGQYATPQQMMIKGAMTTALLELLENNHRRCEVMVGYCIGGYVERLQREGLGNYYMGSRPNVLHTMMIPVKTPGQALQLDQLFFALACPVMHRRLIFSFQERFINDVRKIFNYNAHMGMVQDFDLGKDEWDIIIPATVQMQSTARWKQWLLDQLRSQGIEMA